MTDINTEYGHAPDLLPDAQALTDELRRVLERTAEAVRQTGVPTAERAALELTTLRNTVSSPLRSYPELTRLDEALAVTLGKLPELCRYALPTEIMQAIQTLRRIILCDRRRTDPVPQRHQLSSAICLRELWLIEHRSDLLRSRHELRDAEQLLPLVPADQPQHAKLAEHIEVLRLYCDTQEHFCSSVRQEMQHMLSELRS